MNVVFSLSVWAWGVLVLIALLLALYRFAITRGDYVVLHVRRSELSLVPEQLIQDRRLKLVDFWGHLLTVLALLIGLFLAAVYVYDAMDPSIR